MLPQRAIFKKASEGDFAKMSKPVQVCTACQFVKGQNIGQNYFRVGNNYAVPLVAFWNLCPTWVQVVFEISVSRLVPNLGISERSDTAPLANLARSHFIPDELAGISLSDNLSGSCSATLDQLGPK